MQGRICLSQGICGGGEKALTLGSREPWKVLNRVNLLQFSLVETLRPTPIPSGELFCLPENLDLVDKSGGVGMEGKRQGKRNIVVGFL